MLGIVLFMFAPFCTCAQVERGTIPSLGLSGSRPKIEFRIIQKTIRNPENHINIRILQAIVSGIPFVWDSLCVCGLVALNHVFTQLSVAERFVPELRIAFVLQDSMQN